VDAIVAILAGGRSTRMGRPKPLVELAGRPLLDYPVAAARSVDLEPWVIAKPDTALPPLDCRLVEEPPLPFHPLCGIVAALATAAPRPIVALGADMPFAEDKLLAWLASHLGTTVVSAQGRLQPLLARYDPSDVPNLEAALRRGAPAGDAVAALDPRIVSEDDLRRFGEPAQLCFNVNTPADLELAERLVSARPVAG
jgi:molybdopterin-guanine dinucleotide biosynthesis protein A